MKKLPGVKPGDIVLAAMIFAASIFLFILPFFSGDSTSAELLIVKTGEVRTVSLSENADYTLTSQGITLTVHVEDGKILVTDSDCRDGVCRSTPAISHTGQSIVCAPGGMVVRITGEEAIVDGVSG